MTQTEIRLDHPCDVEGRRFEEREGGRFCHACSEMQYDLRDATRSELVALATKHGGRICARLRLGAAGEPRFRPEPPKRALGAVVAVALAACGSPPQETTASEAPPVTTVEALPPTTTTTQAAPPSSVAVGVDPPPATTDAIDHSTDDSHVATDHHQHAHTHPPVAVDSDPTGLGTIGSAGHPEYGGGVSIARFGGVGTATQ